MYALLYCATFIFSIYLMVEDYKYNSITYRDLMIMHILLVINIYTKYMQIYIFSLLDMIILNFLISLVEYVLNKTIIGLADRIFLCSLGFLIQNSFKFIILTAFLLKMQFLVKKSKQQPMLVSIFLSFWTLINS